MFVRKITASGGRLYFKEYSNSQINIINFSARKLKPNFFGSLFG